MRETSANYTFWLFVHSLEGHYTVKGEIRFDVYLRQRREALQCGKEVKKSNTLKARRSIIGRSGDFGA